MFCRKCGTEFEGKFCPNCGESADPTSTPIQSQPNINGIPLDSTANTPPKNEPFYSKTGFIVLMLVFCCFPLGLILMWKYKKFNKPARFVITAIFVIAILFTLLSSGTTKSTTSENTYTSSQENVELSSNQETETSTISNDISASSNSSESEADSTTTAASTTPVQEETKELTKGQKNALSKASSYLSFTAFSYSGLIKQLEYEQFSTEDATFAVDNCGADWNEQAAKKAQAYLDMSSFSRGSLIDQLKYEGFTQEQAEYGATAVGY